MAWPDHYSFNVQTLKTQNYTRYPDSLCNSHLFESLPSATQATLARARDSNHLIRSIPDLAVFRTAHLVLQCWARTRGILESRYGFLGADSLAILLVVVFKVLVLANSDERKLSSAGLVVAFFAHYASHDWRVPVQDLCWETTPGPSPNRSIDDAKMTVLTTHAPEVDYTATTTRSSTQTVRREILTAHLELSRDQSDHVARSVSGLLQGGEECAKSFLAAFCMYICVDVAYWGVARQRGLMLLSWVESRFATLLLGELMSLLVCACV